MSAKAETIVKSIPKLVAAKDVDALAALRDHSDKKVRKAVRKAIHDLGSRGVDVPRVPSQAWSLGTTLSDLRTDAKPLAMVETRALPGVTRIMISDPDEDAGGVLLLGVLGPGDTVLQFAAYEQTDGQRARMRRDWTRASEGREIPLEWAKARIRHAREESIRSARAVPRALDEHLRRLGDAPTQRPENFLAGQLDTSKVKLSRDVVGEALPLAGAHLWPPLMDMQDMVRELAGLHEEGAADPDEATRFELVSKASKGDDKIREGLGGPVANAIDDAAIGLWVEGELEAAAVCLEAAKQLRSAKDPAGLEWTHPVLAFQVAALARGQNQGQAPDHDD